MTQKEKVIRYIADNEQVHIKEVAKAMDIIEPNIRRILGMGTKEGIFERIGSGIYKITVDGINLLYLYQGDAIELLPELAEAGLKADMVFLDIPYNTPAVKGGNRGIKYNTISVEQFKSVLSSVTKILNPNGVIVYMSSQAISGLKAMKKYTDCFIPYGFIEVAKGHYEKLFGNGLPTTNMRGDIIKPELISVFALNNKSELLDLNWTFSKVRPKGYQTEKEASMIAEIIENTTCIGDTILDPFAGSGVVGLEAIKIGRKAILIEQSDKGIEYIKNNIFLSYEKSN